ncbi:PD40 domain-containing protein [Muricauda sp. MAR_2010_75]|uniref:TolB family protein n=1 Tax=Allomuricauda sp. MAR_2010_75 TaxID=1250232 RepID=UPI0018CE542B|nr:PD40 domain-containing protein [Muricauda sp. MAR_2010_75]
MKKLRLSICIVFSTMGCFAQIGDFEQALDIGDPAVTGSSTYDEATQTYTLTGGGSNIWFNHDEFHFLFKKIKGDFILTANFELVGNEDGNGHRKTGWMIRESTEDDAVSINSCLHGDGLVVLQWRLMSGAYMRDPEDEIFFPKQYFGESIIQLERLGNSVTMRIAHPGEPLEEMETLTMPDLKDEVLVGPYVLAHDPEDRQTAKIWNVRISKPVAPNWHPNHLVETASHEGVVRGSRVETVDIETGKRNVLHISDHGLASPSFSKDGKAIYFLDGNRSYSVPVNGRGAPIVAEDRMDGPERKGKAKFVYYNEGKRSTNQIWRKRANGNEPVQLTHGLDHSWYPHLSPDGKWVAFLSMPHDAKPDEPVRFQNVSIKIMPTGAGAPKTIAHFYGGKGSFDQYAWSPDSKSLVFVSTSQ